MNREAQTYLVKLPIIRSKFQSTNSAKFKGILEIISNENGIIKDWKINFTEVWIDIFTTPSWFENNNNLFKIRNRLFTELELEQEKRPSQKHNKLVMLSEDKILILNNFLNNRKKYNSTIKNIVGLLKGNNPGGEAKRPESAEMILNTKETKIENFVILLDDLREYEINDFDLYKIGSELMCLDDFVNLNESLKLAFEYMQKGKTADDFSIYLKQIKAYYKKYNNSAEKGIHIASVARQKYNTEVSKYYSRIKAELPFGFTIQDTSDYQKCHIYEYHILKDKIIKLLYEDSNANIDKYKEMISDPENFIPLPEELHRRFDNNLFTYNLNGEVYPISKDGYEFVNGKMEQKFKKMDDSFMTKKRQWYLEQRNELIIYSE